MSPRKSPSRKSSSTNDKTGLQRLLRFGIPSLDRLFDQKGGQNEKNYEAGVNLRTLPPAPAKNDQEGSLNERNCESSVNLTESSRDPTQNDSQALDQHMSICVQGPSGTGKSVLGLHLASRYWADSLSWPSGKPQPDPKYSGPRVIYVSTDLGIKRARGTWSSFALCQPNNRSLPFGEKVAEFRNGQLGWNVTLEPYHQGNLENLAKFITGEIPPQTTGVRNGQVAFIDLAESTAGDDWGFINRVMALLPTPQGEQPHHMMIIDAVEGLEMFTGDLDAYGQIRSRRSRIAQILRAAAGKCHVLLVLEEDSAHQHPVEEYVADLVMRLRVNKEENYFRRSLEIVKVRGQTHIRGEHDYVIRQGILPKDQKTVEEWQKLPDDPKENNSYVHILRSLHSLTRVIMQSDQEIKKPARPKDGQGFALMTTPRLGTILPSIERTGRHHTDHNPHTHHFSGLIRGEVTSLIGDEATLKTRLGRAFLAGAFDPQLHIGSEDIEAAVLITTYNLNHRDLTDKLATHWEPSSSASEKKLAESSMKNLLVCRQLEVHHLNSAHLFHIIRRCVEQALGALERHGRSPKDKAQGSQMPEAERYWSNYAFNGPWVRVVIDDWSLIESTHPEIAADKLFLPFLIKYFQRVGVTALIIATQPGKPEKILSDNSEQQLRSLADHHLYTWHVPLYGRDRVAITSLPPMLAELPPSVGELRNPTPEEVPPAPATGTEKLAVNERLWLDRHFEFYKGLDTEKPEPVPLEVHLFSGAEGFNEYAPQLEGIFKRVFTALPGTNVIIPEDHARYAELRDFCRLHGNIHCDHSVVFQVDEYWTETGGGDLDTSITRAESYLNQKTYDSVNQSKAPPLFDPYLSYTAVDGIPSQNQYQYQKHDFFEPPDYLAPKNPPNRQQSKKWRHKAGGIPYQWDFGFLLLKRADWKGLFENAPNRPIVEEKIRKNIENVFLGLTNPERRQSVTWRDFFRACLDISLYCQHPGSEAPPPFDLDSRGPQSFACLVLEIWASELKQIADSDKNSPCRELFARAFPAFRHEAEGKRAERDIGFKEMLQWPDSVKQPDGMWYRLALFRTWMLLAEVIDPKVHTIDAIRLAARPPSPAAVAARQWYSTGSLLWKKLGASEPLVPARLPGCGTTRGDWFLIVGKESRSKLLAERAIDLLCQQRRNLDRLELGLGLPMRAVNQHQLTAMATFDPDGSPRFVRHRELLDLGSKTKDHAVFQWIWRSRLKDYDRNDRLWEKWLGRMTAEAAKFSEQARNKYKISRLKIYDDVVGYFKKTGSFKKITATTLADLGDRKIAYVAEDLNEVWGRFNVMCDFLVSELNTTFQTAAAPQPASTPPRQTDQPANLTAANS